MQIRTILYQYIKALIKHVFLLNFTYELLMSFRSKYKISVEGKFFDNFFVEIFRRFKSRKCFQATTLT